MAFDVANAARLFVDQWTKHKAFCFWCVIAAGATFAAAPLVLGEGGALVRARLAPKHVCIGEHHVQRCQLHLESLNMSWMIFGEGFRQGFARETVWYQPAGIQRRARALRDEIGAPQLLEAIGVLALANALCRLSAAVTDEP